MCILRALFFAAMVAILGAAQADRPAKTDVSATPGTVTRASK